MGHGVFQQAAEQVDAELHLAQVAVERRLPFVVLQLPVQRIHLLEQRPVHAAPVVLTGAESTEIASELSRLQASLGRRLVENQRASLYRR